MGSYQAGGSLNLDAIVLRGISKSYGSAKVLDRVSLEIQEGEIFVLLGSNGSGKSTLLRIMATLLRPESGEVSLLGSEGRPEILRRTGIMFDHTAHWDKLTGYENAWFFARSYGMSEEHAASRLDRLFSWINLEDKKDDAVSTYSFGMRRKLALIEALVHEPKLLFMDEPSMGLDHTSRLSLYSELRETAKMGAAIVLATNDIQEAEFLADRVGLLKSGRLIALGRPSAIVKSLNALTRIEVMLVLPIQIDQLKAIEGVEAVEADKEGFKLRILAISGREMLMPIVNTIIKSGGIIQGIEVREPNLGDAFVKFAKEGAADVAK
jgi:ABC-2 type transport system ATP-binding protein